MSVHEPYCDRDIVLIAFVHDGDRAWNGTLEHGGNIFRERGFNDYSSGNHKKTNLLNIGGLCEIRR